MPSSSVIEQGCLLLLVLWFCHVHLSDLAGILICNSLLFMYYSSTYWKFTTWKRRGISGPSVLPFCGDFTEFICSFWRSKLDRHVRWKKKFGKVYGYHGGNIPILVVSDLAIANQILTSKTCQGKEQNHKSVIGNCIDYTRASSFFKSGKEWSYFINFISHWHNSMSIKQLFGSIDMFGNRCVQAMKMSTCENGVKVEAIFWTMFFELFCELFAGKPAERLGIAGTLTLQTEQNNPLFGNIKTYFPNLCSIVEVTGCLSRQGNDSQAILKRLHKNVEKLFHVVDEDTICEKFRRSFVGQMTEKLKGSLHCSQTSKETVPSEAELVAQFQPIENSRFGVVIMTLLIYELAANPGIQRRCRKECQELIKMNALKSWEDVTNQLPYVVACVYETTRLHPLLGLIIRFCQSDSCIVEGIQIPNGTMIEIMHNDIMTSEEYFPNPTQFIPERFMSKPMHQIRNEGYLLFGLGARKCIGERIMITIMAMTAAHLISKFNFTLPVDSRKPIMEERNNLFMFTESPKILIEKINTDGS